MVEFFFATSSGLKGVRWRSYYGRPFLPFKKKKKKKKKNKKKKKKNIYTLMKT